MAAEFFRVVIIDWRAHGKSSTDGQDFDGAAPITDALTILAWPALVSASHATLIAVGLADCVPGVLFLDWIVNEPTAYFFTSNNEIQTEDIWQSARDEL